MSSEWTISELGKEAINASRPFPFKDYPEVVFVNTGDVLQGKFLHADLSLGKGLPGQAKKALKRDDILLTEIRPGNGRYAFVNFDPSRYVVSTKFMVIQSLGRVSPRYLFHVLTNQSSLDEFQRIAESRSGTFPQITFESISHFPVPVPPLSEQERLVEFLDALEDRITLLQETNATLEFIAQTLFKSWFVDFDPVRAKMVGRAPEGMDEATAALFPDSFEESELGLVPKGWKVRCIDETCELGRGSSPRPIQNFLGGNVPWIKIADATASDGMFVFETKETIINEGVRKSVEVHPGDLIMSNSASCGIAVFVELDGCIHDGWLYFKNYRFISKYFLFFWLRKIADHLVRIADGSVQKNLNIALVSSQRIIIPPIEIVNYFNHLVAPLLDRIRENSLQAHSLANLRDTLLPRLISGQLRLPEAEV